MNTKIIKINSKKPQKNYIDLAAKTIQEGGLVAFPSETVYGLGANIYNENALRNIFKAKERPQDNPLIVHISNFDELHKLTSHISLKSLSLAKKFWPGPLTLILKKNSNISNVVSAGLDSIAIRMPSNIIALELIKKSRVPIAAPSANISTRPSPTHGSHVINDLNTKVDVILDGGNVEIGVESTVIDMTGEVPELLRPGKITKEKIEEVIGDIKENSHTSQKPKSPGMKYKHYSPNAKVIIVESEKDFDNKLKLYSNKKVKLLTYENDIEMAKKLFYDFRECDENGIDIIFVQTISEVGLGKAIMNRLRKASSQ